MAGLAVLLATSAGGCSAQKFGVGAYLSGTHPPVAGSVVETTSPSGTRMLVYLPEGYAETDGRFPATYHLHGAGMLWSWVETDIRAAAAQLEEAVATGDALPRIVVAPYDPDRYSMWSDSLDGSIQRSTELIDLVQHIDEEFRTLASREARVVQGFSMGGFGAALHGLKHQDLFSVVVIFDGALHDWATLNDSRSSIAAEMYGDDEAYFQQWSPWALSQTADPTRTRMLILAGELSDWAERYTAHLEQAGFLVELRSSGCGHDHGCMQEQEGQATAAFIQQHGGAAAP